MTTLLLKKTALINRAQSIALKDGHRSQWSKGVSLFAAEIIEDCEEWTEGLPVDLHLNTLETALLRGATDWAQYFSGACGRHIATVELAEILAPASDRARFISSGDVIETASRAYFHAACAVVSAYFELIDGLKGESAAMALYCLMNDVTPPEIRLWRVCTHVTQGGACFDHEAAFRVVKDSVVNCTYDLALATGIDTDRRGNLLIRSFHNEATFIADKLKAAVEASPFLFKGGRLPKISLIW